MMLEQCTERVYRFLAVNESRERASYGKVSPATAISNDPHKCGGLLN